MLFAQPIMVRRLALIEAAKTEEHRVDVSGDLSEHVSATGRAEPPADGVRTAVFTQGFPAFNLQVVTGNAPEGHEERSMQFPAHRAVTVAYMTDLAGHLVSHRPALARPLHPCASLAIPP